MMAENQGARPLAGDSSISGRVSRDAQAPRYRDMSAVERLAAYNRTGETLLTLEGNRYTNPQSSRTLIREMEFIRRVAKSRGDVWAQRP